MLKKLKILAFSDNALGSKIGEYNLQINPETYSHAHRTGFARARGIDTAGSLSKYRTHYPQEIKFDFVLDATGTVPGVKNVAYEIGNFKKVAYSYNGDIHSPNYLKLVWGPMVFRCMLTSLNITYQLFSPAGTPLRAKLSVAFRQHLTPKEIALRGDKKSDDLTHSRMIPDEPRLSLMCDEVYDDSSLYIKVAWANDLNDIMHLRPGDQLRFPPVED